MGYDEHGEMVYTMFYNEKTGQFHYDWKDGEGIWKDWKPICRSTIIVFDPFYYALQKIYNFQGKDGKAMGGKLAKPTITRIRKLWKVYLSMRENIKRYNAMYKK